MRYVAREFQWLRKRLDLFTAASTTTTERMVDCMAVKKKQRRMILDGKKAYCHVPEEEKLFIDPPKVWLGWWWSQDDGMGDITDPVWVMDKTLYGRRIASKRFNTFVTGILEGLGFEQCLAQPQVYKHFSKDMDVEVHQYDFHSTAGDEQLLELEDLVKDQLMIMATKFLGPGMKYNYLRCTRYLFEHGTLIVPGEKHVDKCLEVLGMQDCKPAPTPWVKEATEDDSELIGEDDKAKYRQCHGIILFYSKYRVDLQKPIQLIGKKTREPTENDFKGLKRSVRYMQGSRQFGNWFPADGGMDCITGCGDTDWATCKDTRKACVWGMVFVDGCMLVHFVVRTQNIQAHSSGEPEARFRRRLKCFWLGESLPG